MNGHRHQPLWEYWFSHPAMVDPPPWSLPQLRGAAPQDAGCLAARTFRCHALLGIPSALGSCELPILGV